MRLGQSEIAAVSTMIWVGFVAVLGLFSLYREPASGGANQARPRWAEMWDLRVETVGRFSYGKLALVSLLGLFLEMLMIRWVSAEIRIFAYFKNFVLIACFLGFGLGCYLCRRRINLLALLVPLVLLTLLIKLPWQGLRNVVATLPILLGSTSQVNMWGVPSMPLDSLSLVLLASGLALVIPLFGLLSLVFIPIGQMVGWYLECAPNGILGYTVNVVASLAGVLLYTMLCFFYQPPAVWFGAAGVMLLLLVWKSLRPHWGCLVALAACVGILSLPPEKDHVVQWSPYQKLALAPTREAGEIISYALTTNDTWYQQILNLSPAFVSSHAELFEDTPIQWNPYNLPYRFYPNPLSVLILGAGMGNDVAAALRNGAGRVVAVEIDPLILQDGRRLHFERPYSSPRVRQVVDDARSYIQNSGERFDLIVFSLLDSHTTSSYYSNIRIDNYVYTVEALQAAKRLLRPEGVFIVKFQVGTPWIAGRLKRLLTTVFGRPPLELNASGSVKATTPGRFFISGSQEVLDRALSNPELAAYAASHSAIATEKATLTTDDWPYFYQHEPGLPASVIAISIVLVLLCWLLMRRTGIGGGSIQWHFFFLGAGFLLLEAQIISKFALLFGTTWVVNSVVISGVLVLIVAANFLVALS
ncbi:MAG TPA: methyltransferase domain-containing protein, partial [Bryobacterales bacterium]|nr:methyltransferase domain-containing protein [Bryobacterales bacterium]